MKSSPKMRVALTGGGTAGHVMPHLAMLGRYREMGWDVLYIGSQGIEKDLLKGEALPFFEIQVGKLRRYFSLKNMLDFFRVGIGLVQSLVILLRNRPALVFSKGGFVSVPVAMAAWFLRIPVVSHESDVTPGLANRIISRFAKKILYSFPDTKKYVPAAIAEWTGVPIRSELFTGDRLQGMLLCGFDPQDTKPVLLVTGGSQGALKINEAIYAALPDLLRQFRIIHLTGVGKGRTINEPGYKSFEFVKGDLKNLLAAADLVISRSGANTIFELLALRKPMLLVPLEEGSRGDQVHNAESFVRNHWALALRERDLTASQLMQSLQKLTAEKEQFCAAMAQAPGLEATGHIIDILTSVGMRRY